MMKSIGRNLNPFVALLLIFVTACNYQTKTSSDKFQKTTIVDTINYVDSINHGYNELANPDESKTFTISDYNTDNREIKNIVRPDVSTISSSIDTALLFGIWTNDPEGPHADFRFTKESFYVVDYDGDGAMPFELNENKLKIYYNDFIQEGKIISVDKDTLKVIWKDLNNINHYVRWKQ